MEADFDTMRVLKELPGDASPEMVEAVRSCGAMLHDAIDKRGDELCLDLVRLSEQRMGPCAQLAVIGTAAISAGALCAFLLVQLRPASSSPPPE